MRKLFEGLSGEACGLLIGKWMRACAECARQGGETPSLQGPGIGGAQSRASAQKFSEVDPSGVKPSL